MEAGKVTIRHLTEEDRQFFIDGIRDKSLRSAYGFPADMNDMTSSKIFQQFYGLNNAFALISQPDGNMVGFLLDVNPELPGNIRVELPEKGQTLAFAVFPPWQRQGYMEAALHHYIDHLLYATETAYIHCGHFNDNEPSRRLLQKLGFHEYTRHPHGDRIIVDEILFR